MRIEQINAWVQILKSTFGEPKDTVNLEPLKVLHKQKDYTAIVGSIKKQFLLDLRIVVGYVNSGGPDGANAWVESGEEMPFYGTDSFREHLIRVYFRKSYLAEASFEMALSTMSHELAHIVLNSLWHPHRRQEEIVDLTAMFLGYRNAFLIGSRGVIRIRHMPGETEILSIRRGYLSEEETRYASTLMSK